MNSKRLLLSKEQTFVITRINSICNMAVWFADVVNKKPKIDSLHKHLQGYFRDGKIVSEYLPEHMHSIMYQQLNLDLDEINLIQELNSLILSFAEENQGVPMYPLYKVRVHCKVCENLLNQLKQELQS